MRHTTKEAAGCPRNRRKPGAGDGKGEAANATGRPVGYRGVSFRASIPPTETAIKIHGEGGARMLLDIAESDLGGFLPALVMRGKSLKVTLEEHE